MSTLYGQEHVKRYRETDGEEGYVWKEGSKTLLLTTTGRVTGQETTTPLIFGLDGDNPVIVASQGGAPKHPGWYRNLRKHPEVGVQIKGERFRARARDAEGEERERLWRMMNGEWPHYAEYQERTDRRIPVVVLERI
ncbi:MAG TPA: nitroreductase family deazaflavin-dependent oxidoreductase [Gaiellaceae bacterium]|jgi:proline iminopeptidase|nr:nitroreductase family deazaflavin-dependent oxidoreductase [Gaiellaceae bacterium]